MDAASATADQQNELPNIKIKDNSRRSLKTAGRWCHLQLACTPLESLQGPMMQCACYPTRGATHIMTGPKTDASLHRILQQGHSMQHVTQASKSWQQLRRFLQGCVTPKKRDDKASRPCSKPAAKDCAELLYSSMQMQ